MALKFIANIGWIDTEKSGSPDKQVVAPPTQEQKNAAFAAEKTARDNAYGSPAWVKENFPEYAEVDTSVQTTTGGQMGKNGIRAPSVTRTVAMPRDVVLQQQPWASLGFRELWDSTPPEQRGALADNINFYRNGGKDAQGFKAIDPKSYNNLEYAGKNGQGRKIFNGENGTLVAGQHPQMYKEPPMNPDGSPGVSPKRGQEYGINSTFTSKDGVTFSPKYYGTVLKDFSPDKKYSGPGGKMVPGWQYIAKNLGLDSSQGLYTGNIATTNYEFSGAKVGDSIVGHYGYMWDRDVKTRRQQRDARRGKKSSPVQGGGGSPGSGGGPGGGGPGSGGGGGQPGEPGGPPPITNNQQPNTNAPPRGPVDYGPAPFDPYPGGDPYGGQGYEGYGHEGYQGYQRPIFGGDSQWTSMYNDWLSSGGPDISKYAPQTQSAPPPATDVGGGVVPDDPGAAPPGETYYDYYNRYIGGGGQTRGPTRPH